MNILVTFAVSAEFAPWQKRRNFRQLPGDLPVFEAQSGSVRICALLTGMGQARAVKVARQVLSDRPEICISTGLAGALRGEYSVGEILAARLVSEVDEPLAVASHRDLLSMALDCGARQIERFATSRSVVGRVEEKRALASQAEAVEMESYAILAEAARYGVPAVAVRAISDALDFEMPADFSKACDDRGQIRIASVVAQILRHPSRIPAFAALTRNCRYAASCLADFLDQYTVALGDRFVAAEQDIVEAR